MTAGDLKAAISRARLMGRRGVHVRAQVDGVEVDGIFPVDSPDLLLFLCLLEAHEAEIKENK